MPRKAKKKTDKAPLLFLEQPSSGSRLQPGPEVRAAVTPRGFFTEDSKTAASSSLHAWVSPQFDRSALAAPPARRGRRRGQSAASVLDGAALVATRKTSVCRFPSLTFRTRPREEGAERWGGERRGTERPGAEGRGAERPGAERPGAEGRGAQRRGAERPASCRVPDVPWTPPGGVEPPPGVEPPTASASGFLLDRPPTPPGPRPPDSLVADTPERDYGLKVTWRRRRTMMLKLREAGLLSEDDTRVQQI